MPDCVEVAIERRHAIGFRADVVVRGAGIAADRFGGGGLHERGDSGGCDRDDETGGMHGAIRKRNLRMLTATAGWLKPIARTRAVDRQSVLPPETSITAPLM